MKTIHEMILDVCIPSAAPMLLFHKGDVDSREIRVTLQDCGNTVTLDNTMSAEFDAVTNGVIVAAKQAAEVDVEHNVIRFVLSGAALSVAGIMRIELRVTEGSEVIVTRAVKAVVEDAVITPDAVPSAEMKDAIAEILRGIVGDSIDADAVNAAVTGYLEEHPVELTGVESADNKFNAFTALIPNYNALTPQQQAAYYPTLHLLYQHFYDRNTVDGLLDSLAVRNGTLYYTDADGVEQAVGDVGGDSYTKAEITRFLAAKATLADMNNVKVYPASFLMNLQDEVIFSFSYDANLTNAGVFNLMGETATTYKEKMYYVYLSPYVSSVSAAAFPGIEEGAVQRIYCARNSILEVNGLSELTETYHIPVSVSPAWYDYFKLVAIRSLWERKANADEIPSKVSDLQNDSGYLTEHQSLAGYATTSQIPIKVSQLQNDSGYLTEHQSLAGYATTSQIPTKVSQLQNDSGFLTAHQDVSGKEDASNKFDGYTAQISAYTALSLAQKSAYYPTLKFLYEHFYTMTAVDNFFENMEIKANGDLVYVDNNGDEVVIGNVRTDISGKADRAATLSGYGITNAYTKSETDAAIAAAIGGVENGTY